jgi:hypothetical protein
MIWVWHVIFRMQGLIGQLHLQWCSCATRDSDQSLTHGVVLHGSKAGACSLITVTHDSTSGDWQPLTGMNQVRMRLGVLVQYTHALPVVWLAYSADQS